MLKIWSMVCSGRVPLVIEGQRSWLADKTQKQQQQQAENAERAAGKKKKKVTPAQLRVQRGMSPFRALYPGCTIGEGWW